LQKLLMMILLVVLIGNSQTVVIPSMTTWTNTDTVSYFAIDRPRMERMLLKAEIYDTTFSLLVEEDKINQRLEQSRDNWKTTAIVTTSGVILLLIWGVIN